VLMGASICCAVAEADTQFTIFALSALKKLQVHTTEISTKEQGDIEQLASTALQDLLNLQFPVIIGLIGNLTGNTLQDDIAQTIVSAKA